MKNKQIRIDLLLVIKNLAPTRTLAQDLIKNGQVFFVSADQRRLVLKVSESYSEEDTFDILPGFAGEFVSRSGHKIKGVAEALKLNFQDKTCLDIGVSTGGFSDFLLRQGARQVIGVDVGQNQTHKTVKNNPRFILYEKINARFLNENVPFQEQVPKDGFDFICMDVSFISIKLILPQLKKILSKNGQLLVLVKPQFELGATALNEKGIVKDPGQYLKLEQEMIEAAKKLDFKVQHYLPSPIDGKDGNKEFFLFLT